MAGTEEISIKGASEALAELQGELDALATVPSDLYQRKNLDGSAPVALVLATLAVQALPNFMSLVSKYIEWGHVTEVQVGDIKITNPQEKDLELMRALIAKRLSA